MYTGVSACVCKVTSGKTKGTTNRGGPGERALAFHYAPFHTFLVFVTTGIYYQFKFKMNWGGGVERNKNIMNDLGRKTLPSAQGSRRAHSPARPQSWFSGRPVPNPPIYLYVVLTWTTVVRVSVHTLQEGHSRQGWLPTAAFGGHQTTAYRAGREGGRNEQFQWLAPPLLLSSGWQAWSCMNPSRRMVSHLPLKTHTKPWYTPESSREALRNHFMHVKGLNLAGHACSPLPFGPLDFIQSKGHPRPLEEGPPHICAEFFALWLILLVL